MNSNLNCFNVEQYIIAHNPPMQPTANALAFQVGQVSLMFAAADRPSVRHSEVMEAASMSTLNKFWVLLFLWLVIIDFPASAQEEKEESDLIYLTWMSNTNWLVEVGDTRIVIDGWITRIPRPRRPDLKNPETLYIPPTRPDVSSIQRVLEAVNENKRLDYIFSGHSHFDHSFDTAVWAKLTGAKIIDPKSTCLQAISQGIPES